jgi:putative nucleotidyltransferase with HDIG domain
MSEEEIEHVRIAGLFHDIGKSVVPESLIAKSGPLSKPEAELIQRHVDESERISRRLGLNQATLKLIELHHARFDSPECADLPMGARVLAAADAMAAMLSDRAYRRACSSAQMIGEMRRQCGTQFDPRVVDAVTSLADHWRVSA